MDRVGGQHFYSDLLLLLLVMMLLVMGFPEQFRIERAQRLVVVPDDLVMTLVGGAFLIVAAALQIGEIDRSGEDHAGLPLDGVNLVFAVEPGPQLHAGHVLGGRGAALAVVVRGRGVMLGRGRGRGHFFARTGGFDELNVSSSPSVVESATVHNYSIIITRVFTLN